MKNKNNKNGLNIDPGLPFKGVWGYVWFTIKPHWKMFLGYAFFGTLVPFLTAGSSLLYKYVIDATEARDVQMVLVFALAIPLLSYGIAVTYRIAGFFGRNFFPEKRKRDTEILIMRLLGQSGSYFANRFSGALSTKVNTLIGNSQTLVMDFFGNYIDGIVLTALTIIVGSMMHPLVGLVVFVGTFLVVMLNIAFVAKTQEISKITAKARAKVGGGIVDTVTNNSTVRLFAAKLREHAFIADYADVLMRADKNFWRRNTFIAFINTTLVFIYNGIAIYLIFSVWKTGTVSTGDFILMITLAGRAAGEFMRISRAMNSTTAQIGEMKEALEDIFAPYTMTDIKNAPELKAGKADIVWENVTFDYKDMPVFSDFSFTIPAGQRIGLVGPSGAGKSTFMSLLLREHDVQKGIISIAGQNIAEVTQDSLRNAIAVVPQDTALFHRSLFDNIAYGKEGATESEVHYAAKKAQIHDFIMSLPEGYKTEVGERGVKLSGGQRQRVAIARAMIKDAPILILDEATSALDSEGEHEVQKALHTLMQGKTVIAIAHRLSTLKEMDRIVVLEDGIVTEDGTHTSLKDAGGTYSRLWGHQAGGFIEG